MTKRPLSSLNQFGNDSGWFESNYLSIDDHEKSVSSQDLSDENSIDASCCDIQAPSKRTRKTTTNETQNTNFQQTRYFLRDRSKIQKSRDNSSANQINDLSTNVITPNIRAINCKAKRKLVYPKTPNSIPKSNIFFSSPNDEIIKHEEEISRVHLNIENIIVNDYPQTHSFNSSTRFI